MAWVIVNKDVSTCILGASKESQLDDNFRALELYKKLTPELLTEILLYNKDTSLEEIQSFINRSLYCQYNNFYYCKMWAIKFLYKKRINLWIEKKISF